MLGHSDCDTELSLSPGGRRYTNSLQCNSACSTSMERSSGEIVSRQQQQQQQQQEEERPVTIYYGGQCCTCDVTEIQARAIICMAKREMEEMAKKEEQLHHGHHHSQEPSPYPQPLSSLVLPKPLNEGLSMKRSLQSFLQKRKARTR